MKYAIKAALDVSDHIRYKLYKLATRRRTISKITLRALWVRVSGFYLRANRPLSDGTIGKPASCTNFTGVSV